MTRAINDPGNEDPGSLLETDADALLGGAAAQAPEERACSMRSTATGRWIPAPTAWAYVCSARAWNAGSSR